MKKFVKKMPLVIIAILSLAFSIAQNVAAKNSNTADPQLILSSLASQDGWVLESSENSNMGRTLNNDDRFLYLGDDNSKKQYIDILSFKTSEIPDDAIITNMVLKVKQYGILGNGDPVSMFHGFVLEIVKGHFGTYATLQISDFQTAAQSIYGPITPALVKKTYTFNLKDLISFVNKRTVEGGVTQIRLGFAIDDNNDDFTNAILLYSGDAALTTDRPQLIISYTAR